MPNLDEEEPVLCAQCGQPLAESALPCRSCEGPEGSPDAPGAMQAYRLHRRSRNQLMLAILGFFDLPWLWALLSARTAQRGLALARSAAPEDAAMAHRLRRMLILATVVAMLGFAGLFARFLF